MLHLRPIQLFKTVLLFAIVSIFGCQHSNGIIHSPELQTVSKLDSQFQYHFHILDSIADAGFKDPSLRAQESIYFMERYTRIEGEADQTFFGVLYFTPSDFTKWHSWYELHKDSIRNIRDNP